MDKAGYWQTRWSEWSEIENQRAKNGKRNMQRKHLQKQIVDKVDYCWQLWRGSSGDSIYRIWWWWLIGSEKEIENVADESFAVGNGAKEDFISLKMAGKRNISCYAAEIMIFMDMSMKSGFTNSWTIPINLSWWTSKYFAFLVIKLQKLLSPITSKIVRMPSITLVFRLFFVHLIWNRVKLSI